MDRRMHCWSLEPIDSDRPTRFVVWIKRQRNTSAAAAWASEAGPFANIAGCHYHQLIGSFLAVGWIIRLPACDEIGAEPP